MGPMFFLRYKKAGQRTLHKNFDWGQLKGAIFNQVLCLRNFPINFIEDDCVSHFCYTWNAISFKCDYHGLLALGTE